MGQLVPIYHNSQTNTELLGIGRLVSKVKDGLPFITQGLADNKQKVWIEEFWIIEWVHQTKKGFADPRKKFPIRTLFKEGISTSKINKSNTSIELKDKFLEVNGIEIY